MRTDLGSGHSKLRPPAAVGEGIVFPPIQGYLFPISDVQTRIRKHTVSRLRPPTVVTQPQPFIQLPLSINLTQRDAVWRRNNQRMVQWNVRKPTVIDLSPQTKFLSVNLAYSRRGAPKSVLRKPTDTVGLEDQGRVRVTLAPSAKQGRAAHSALGPPAVIDLRPQTKYLSVNLTYSRRGTTRSVLHPPSVVTPVSAGVFGGPLVQFTRIQPARVIWFLRPPTVVLLAVEIYGPSVSLTRIRPRPTTKFLGAPTDLVDEQDKGRVRVTLAYSSRGRPLSQLRPPAVVAPVLAPPVTVTLAPQRRGAPRSVLQPPAVVQPASLVFYGPTVTLTYSKRGRPVCELRPPAVIDIRPQTVYLSVTLAPSRRGRPMRFLRPAVLAAPKSFEAVSVRLAYSVRKRGRTLLRKPVVVFPFLARGVDVTLVRIRRPKFTSRLAPPAVVRVRDNKPIQVVLTRIAPRPTVATLKPPTVVFYPPVETTVRSWFAYQSRGVTRSALKAPTVVFPPALGRPIDVTLTRIVPPQRFWLLLPPAVVNTFVPPHGDVCGFDIAGSFVCDETVADINVQGTDGPGSAVTGSDTPESRITGTDNAVGEVCGTDEQAT